VLQRGLALGFDAVCTGHYARLVKGADGIEMHRAVDADKDQSYVLGVLNQGQLRHSLFPLGGSLKSDVRAEAERRGLAVADKPDSHDICFIADGNTAGFLDGRLGTRPGIIADESGATIDQHEGTHHYTVGQRKGLHIGTPAPDGRPRYVLDISPVTNTITVGPRESLLVREISGIRPTWTDRPVTGPWRGQVQVRAHGEPVTAEFACAGDRVVARLDAPIAGVAAGQALVAYRGSRVVGSATISATAS
jgi:tRNA-specific 2-thiouridylase